MGRGNPQSLCLQGQLKASCGRCGGQRALASTFSWVFKRGSASKGVTFPPCSSVGFPRKSLVTGSWKARPRKQQPQPEQRGPNSSLAKHGLSWGDVAQSRSRIPVNSHYLHQMSAPGQARLWAFLGSLQSQRLLRPMTTQLSLWPGPRSCSNSPSLPDRPQPHLFPL